MLTRLVNFFIEKGRISIFVCRCFRDRTQRARRCSVRLRHAKQRKRWSRHPVHLLLNLFHHYSHSGHPRRRHSQRKPQNRKTNRPRSANLVSWLTLGHRKIKRSKSFIHLQSPTETHATLTQATPQTHRMEPLTHSTILLAGSNSAQSQTLRLERWK